MGKFFIILGFLIMMSVALLPGWYVHTMPQQLDVLIVLPTKVDSNEGEQTLFSLINQQRISSGLNPLDWDESLATYSRKHSADMASSGSVYHNQAELAQVKAGENALMMPRSWGGYGLLPYFYFNFYRPHKVLWEDSVQAWMNSPGHKENILTPSYTHTGIGIAVAADGVTFYVTQDFK